MEINSTMRVAFCTAVTLLAIRLLIGYFHIPEYQEFVRPISTYPSENLILIEGNTLHAAAALPLKIGTLGVLYSNVDIFYYLDQCSWDFNIAYNVLKEESRGNPSAINWSDYHKSGNCYGSFGLFQLACFMGPPHVLLDPIINIQIACKLYEKEGWKPWGVCTNGTVNCGLIKEN